MNEGAGKRGKARQQRRQTMAIQRQMLGRIKPGKSAERLSTGGTLAARASLRRARAKAGPGASPAQRGAVKRAGTYLKASKKRNRAAVKGAASRGTVAKPKGLKQGAVTARVKARAAAVKSAVGKVKTGKKAKIDDSKVYRVTNRLNNVVRNSDQKTGVKRLNAIQVGARAKSFLARKEGGSVGMLNQKSQPEAYASVRKAMTKPPRYSTQKPNRNKPGRFNDLGQDKARIKARRDAMTTRDKIQEYNKLAAAKTKAQKTTLSRAAIKGGALSRRELGYSSSLRNGFARAPRVKGTIPKPKQQSKVSSNVTRTRSQAKAAQRNRREQILNNTRISKTGVWRMKQNPRIRSIDTGMSQLSLIGKAKTLKRYRPVK
jgi:hypothetical protein